MIECVVYTFNGNVGVASIIEDSRIRVEELSTKGADIERRKYNVPYTPSSKFRLSVKDWDELYFIGRKFYDSRVTFSVFSGGEKLMEIIFGKKLK